jgi:NhaP-type Na+/H+ or K+/H+ antiporter
MLLFGVVVGYAAGYLLTEMLKRVSHDAATVLMRRVS